jgi:hypothetical protein
MRRLTKFQQDFILENFFKEDGWAGWRHIATHLLTNGNCIVAGESCIWVGGIGNFIKVAPADNAVGCSLYTFDLDLFLTSEWYKQVANQYFSILANKKAEIEQEYNEIHQIIQ